MEKNKLWLRGIQIKNYKLGFKSPKMTLILTSGNKRGIILYVLALKKLKTNLLYIYICCLMPLSSIFLYKSLIFLKLKNKINSNKLFKSYIIL